MTPRIVRLPAPLVDYACQRTLVCCRPPWRVYLGPQEDVVLRGRLRATGAAATAARFARAIERPAHGVTLVAQPDSGCAMLDDGPDELAGCALQSAAGLGALPQTCRNFPRSIVRTPRGVEVAFLLQCPTVVDHIVRAPAPLTWVERDLDTWAYDARRAVRDPLWWDGVSSLRFEALEDLRTAWWERLGASDCAPAAAATLAVLRSNPGDPTATPSTSDLTPTRLGAEAVDTELSFLGRLDGRGPDYRRAAVDTVAALTPDARQDELAAVLAAAPLAFACAAAVTLQFAGVHSGQPVADGLRGAAWQTSLALDLAARLTRLAWVPTSAAVRDALTVAAHLARWAAHAEPKAP